MAKMITPKEMGAAKTPVKSFSKLGAAPTVKTPATAVTSKTPEAKPVAKSAKPAYNRLSNLGDFAHPVKKKKG
jgi:hypothetical protein